MYLYFFAVPAPLKHWSVQLGQLSIKQEGPSKQADIADST